MSDSSHVEDPSRRALLRHFAAAGVGALLTTAFGAAAAQGQHMPGMPGGGMGHGGMSHGAGMGDAHADTGATPPPAGAAMGPADRHAIPWSDTCAFCGMTLTNPTDAPQGPLFRERTYAQWAFANEARHFESIGCALGWAYAHGVRDGMGASLYVAAYDQIAAPTAPLLAAARDATFLWAERLPASMMARVAAFRHYTDAVAFAAGRGDALGRRRFIDLTLLEDMAPPPIANLFPLLQRQMG